MSAFIEMSQVARAARAATRGALALAVVAAAIMAGPSVGDAAAAQDARLAVGTSGAGVVASIVFGGQVKLRGVRDNTYDVVVRTRDAAGRLGSRRTITTGLVEAGSLTAAANASGVGIVAWAQTDLRRGTGSLYAARCSSRGCGAPVLVDAHQTKRDGAALQAVVRPNGVATLLWISGLKHFSVSQLTADVPPKGTATAIVRLGDAGENDALALDGKGNVVAAWPARRFHNVNGLTIATRAATSTRFSKPRLVTSLAVRAVALTGRPAGGVHVVATAPRGATRGVLSFDVGSPPGAVLAAGPQTASPAACVLDDGGALVAWVQPGRSIVVQAPAAGRATSIATHALDPIGLVASPGAGATLVWTEPGRTVTFIRAAAIGPAGQIGPKLTIAGNARMTDVAATTAGTLIAGLGRHGTVVVKLLPLH